MNTVAQWRHFASTATVVLMLLFSQSVPALSITLNKGGGLLANPSASAAFDNAALFYEGLFTDPIDIFIDADLATLGVGILGQTNPTLLSSDYDIVRNAVVNDQIADVGTGDITDQLPTAAQFIAALPAGFSLSGNLLLGQANVVALGFGRITSTDATITLTTRLAFDYDPSDGINTGQYDFYGVAVHEIGHALGFISEVDYVDAVLAAGETANDVTPSTLDLFRMAQGDGDIDFTSSARLLTPGATSVTYLGPGYEKRMATGSTQGDGDQASHWRDNQGIGIMAPSFDKGEPGIFTDNDLRAFDLIGWDVALTTVPVPPAIYPFLSGLFALVGLAGRHRIR